MQQLLSYKTIRILNIAAAVVVYEDSINYDEIQHFNDCSRKTVMDDLHYIKEYWNHLIPITLKQLCIKSETNSVYDLMKFKARLYHEEIKIQFLLSLFLNPGWDIPQHAQALHYSESHLRRQINPINEYLERFESKINFNKDAHGYVLESDNEILLCYMLAQIIKVSDNANLLPNLKDCDYDDFEIFRQSYFSFIPESMKLDTDKLYGVIIIRMRQGYYTKEHNDQFLNSKIKYEERKSIFYNLFKNYTKDLEREFTEEEVDKVVDIFSLLANQIDFAPFRIDNHMNRYDYFYLSFKQENKKYATYLKLALKELKDSYNIDYEDYASELIFHFYTHIHSFRTFKALKIGVYSDLGENHTHSLLISIRKHFPMHDLEQYNENSDYDFVISTNNEAQDFANNDIVRISDYMGVNDLKRIYTHIYIDRDAKIDFNKQKKVTT